MGLASLVLMVANGDFNRTNMKKSLAECRRRGANGRVGRWQGMGSDGARCKLPALRATPAHETFLYIRSWLC